MSAVTAENHFAAIWERILCPSQGDFSPEQARFYLRLRIPEEDRNRVKELSAKARAGTLSPDEAYELDQYLLIDSFLTSLKTKARLSLEQAQAPS